jgi:hypothetical protein
MMAVIRGLALWLIAVGTVACAQGEVRNSGGGGGGGGGGG